MRAETARRVRPMGKMLHAPKETYFFTNWHCKRCGVVTRTKLLQTHQQTEDREFDHDLTFCHKCDYNLFEPLLKSRPWGKK